jgi:hypothetical protein
MGNKFFSEKFENYPSLKIKQSESFSLEQMIDDKMLDHFFTQLNSTNSMYMDPTSNDEMKKFFEESSK